MFLICYNEIMKIDYNIEKISKLLHDLYLLTNLTLGFWDNNMNLMVVYPPEQTSFCRKIRSTAKGLERCLECDRIILHYCAITNTVCTRNCHAGIPDSALPLYHNELLLGFITFGQFINLSTNNLSYEEIRSLWENPLQSHTDIKNTISHTGRGWLIKQAPSFFVL